MTRAQAIDLIRSKLSGLPDERVEALAELAEAWSKPTVYSTLSAEEKSDIDAAIYELDRGEGVPLSTISADLEAKINADGK